MSYFGKLFGPQQLFNSGILNDSADNLYTKGHLMLDRGDLDGCTLIHKAAYMGHPEAAFEMGNIVMSGSIPGGPEDAVKFYEISARGGNAKGLTNLANCLQSGCGIEQNTQRAINLLKIASILGDDMANFNLGQMYIGGFGIPQDEAQGWNLLSESAKNGNKESEAYINDLLSKGFTPPAIVENNPNSINYSSDFLIDHASDVSIDSQEIRKLYKEIVNGNTSKVSDLLDLTKNHINRDAMNALRKLGLVSEDMSDNFKYGCADFIANSWKEFDVWKLETLIAWTYPYFTYVEYDATTESRIFESKIEKEFIQRIGMEFDLCLSKNLIPKYRIRESKCQGKFCIDVYIQGESISTFHLAVNNSHFVGLYRVYNEISKP